MDFREAEFSSKVPGYDLLRARREKISGTDLFYTRGNEVSLNPLLLGLSTLAIERQLLSLAQHNDSSGLPPLTSLANEITIPLRSRPKTPEAVASSVHLMQQSPQCIIDKPILVIIRV